MNRKVGGILESLFPGRRITGLKRFSKGLIHETYEFKVDNKVRVLRISDTDFWKIRKEKYLYELIRRKTDVPLPRIFKTGRNFTLMSRVPGKELSTCNPKLVLKAGEYLAKIHSIKFSQFGWIIGREIRPRFREWRDFIKYDIKSKFGKIPGKYRGLRVKIERILKENQELLDIHSRPCLLHKDYHASHIIVDKGKIRGIIDLEWAMSGHNEFDIVKSCLWMFAGNSKGERAFLDGYKRYGEINLGFTERKRLYELLIMLSSLSFSFECRHQKWCRYNLQQLQRAIHEYNKNN
jgi:aminoglycoside phosphotransferase (APT) family kinase protein